MTPFFKRIVALLFVVFTLSFSLLNTAYAQNIKNLRSFHNTQKSRVVIDTTTKPNYATSLSANKAVFSVRVRDVANAKTAPTQVPLSSKSCITSISKKLDGDDVRYIFGLKDCSNPKAFVLAPSKDSKDYRIVLDFENGYSAFSSNSNSSSNTRTTTTITQTNSSVSSKVSTSSGTIDVNTPLATYERDLWIKYTTVGKGGARSMSPKNAQAYKNELTALRANYQKAKQQVASNKAAANKSASKTKVQSTVTHDVEELVSDTSAPPVPVKATPVSRPFIICIDPGHGGKDPGAIGRRGVREKNVTLAISKALVNYINSNKQFRGVFTRSSDIFIDLDRRSEIARRKKADLLISIHADSVESGSSTARGASILVLSENRASRENNKNIRNGSSKHLLGVGEVMDQSVGNPYLATALVDMSSTNSRSEGNLLAKEILNSLSRFTHVRKTSPISRSLAVLKAPDIPSLLIETGYLSNRYEEIQLNQPNYQKQIAYRIYLGIKSYYEKYPAQKIKSRQESYARTKNIKGKKSVTVKKGESLSIIARRYGTTVTAIKKLNNLNSTNVHVGQTIYIP